MSDVENEQNPDRKQPTALQNASAALDDLLNDAIRLGVDRSKVERVRDQFEAGKLTRLEFMTFMQLQQDLNISLVESLMGLRSGNNKDIEEGVKSSVRDLRAILTYIQEFYNSKITEQSSALDDLKLELDRIRIARSTEGNQ